MTKASQESRDQEETLLGKAALEQGLISSAQLKEAMAVQARDAGAGRPAKPLGLILVLQKALDEAQYIALIREVREQPVETFMAPPAAGPLPAHAHLGTYTLLREVGRGGMAVVYEAVDDRSRRPVALKMLLLDPDGDGARALVDEQRFLRESELVARIPPHPNLVGVYEAGVAEGKRFIAMEYVKGLDFGKWAQARNLVLPQKIEALRKVALAVEHAHRHGVIHRDLKPENVLMDPAGEPHVTDFGLARAVRQDGRPALTLKEMTVGTPAYMSPEQAQGLKTLDHRTDVYSLGVMIYEVLAGRKPFEGESAMEVLARALKQTPALPSRVMAPGGNTLIAEGLEKICLKAMEKNPAGRYRTAEALAEDLGRWIRGDDVRAGARSTRRVASFVRPYRWFPWVAALGILLCLGAMVISFSEYVRDRDEIKALRQRLAAANKPALPAIAVDLKAFKYHGPGYFRVEESRLHFGSNGRAEATVRFPESGEYELAFMASCDPAHGVFAEFNVTLNGAAGKPVALTAREPRDYRVTAWIEAGERKLGIEYTNDLHEPDLGIDRNLFIHAVGYRRVYSVP